MSAPSGINDALQELCGLYRKNLPAKLEEIESLWQSMQQSVQYDAEMMELIHRLVHSLTGSGATFGLTEVSNTARKLETTIKENLHSTQQLSDELRSRIREQLQDLKSAANCPDAEFSTQAMSEVISGHTQAQHTAILPLENAEKVCILLVVDDYELARNLEQQLLHFGYAVNVLHVPALINAAIAEMSPRAIIMDVDSLEAEMAEPQAIGSLFDDAKGDIPVIFISSRKDLEARLSAVRAGAIAYITKPVDVGMLIDKLDNLIGAAAADAFKVLIVDDSPSLAAYYAETLQSVGMDTRVVTDPLKMLDAISDFIPELILMDLYMPGCNGMELASLTRQQEEYVSTPIVFLSAEKNIEIQLAAMQLGADAFLTKPIQPAHLISSVASKVQRYRKLRTFMVRDSLTGLLNHTKTKEELDSEMLRAQRQKSPLAFAMIDIDLFKNVNDTYGHAAGDQVIKTLARILQQRLRKTDIVGRYGGEEFAVILKDTEAEPAFNALDEIRRSFEKIEHHSQSGGFHVSFSCGVAAFPEFYAATEISNAADMALYEAKRGGRNMVVMAQPADKI